MSEFKEGLRILGVFLTHDELAKVFTFIDLNEDGKIDNFEFVDYFLQILPVYQDEQEAIDHDRLKSIVLEHLISQFNYREISLLEGFKDGDQNNKGYLDYEDFNLLLYQAGADYEDSKVRLLFEILDTKDTGKITFSDFETRMQ